MDWQAITDLVAVRAADPQLRTDLKLSPQAGIAAPLDLSCLPDLESALGFAVPRPLLDLFQNIGNGGFGPGYGLMRLAITERHVYSGNALAVHRFLTGVDFGDLDDPEDPGPAWPHGLLPIVHWGCSMYSILDCLDPTLPVLFWDNDRPDAEADLPIRATMQASGIGFTEWMHRWALGNPDPLG